MYVPSAVSRNRLLTGSLQDCAGSPIVYMDDVAVNCQPPAYEPARSDRLLLTAPQEESLTTNGAGPRIQTVRDGLRHLMQARVLFAQAMAQSVDLMVQDPSGDIQLLHGRAETPLHPAVMDRAEEVAGENEEVAGCGDRDEGS